MREELVAALAEALEVPLPSERIAEVTTQVEGQLAGRGGSSPEELEGVEPAIVFEPGWEA
jgi:hypothetical protein